MQKTWIVDNAKDMRKMSDIRDQISGIVPVEKSMCAALVFEELFVNIGKYAYQDTGTPFCEAYVKVSVKEKNGECIIVFTDKGIEFDPTKYDVSIPNGKQIGGHGIRFVKNLAKSIRYERVNRENILTVTI